MPKKKVKVASWVVEDSVYGCDFHLVLSPSAEGFHSWGRKVFDDPQFPFVPDAEACFVVRKDGSSPSIWVREKDAVLSISHECLHYAVWVLASKGVAISEENSEALTYFHQFAFRECLRLLGRRDIIKKYGKTT